MGDWGWIICFLVVFGVLIAISVANNNEAARKRAALQAASDAYQGSLAELKAAPTNPDLKQKALELGRAYSSLTRQGKGVTIYDEAALGNDISAATAAASAPAPVASAEERLKRLDELKAGGAITAEEYTARRQAIVNEL